MDKEEDYMDFKSLRARFQEEKMLLLNQPRTKPAIAEKPKVLSPPHSPTNSPTFLSPNSHAAFTSNNLPHGAQPSILSTLQEKGGIGQDKGGIGTRFTFKDVGDKKAKSKDEGKLKLPGKKKADREEDEMVNGGNDVVDGPKKEDLYMKLPKSKKGGALLSTGGSKRGSVELVSVPPPPGNLTVKKKGFLGIKKITKPGKKGKDYNHPFPLLDIASADLAYPEPLAPLTTFGTQAPSLDTTMPSPLNQPDPATRIALLPRAQIPVLPPGADRNQEIALISAAAQGSTVVTPPSPITVMTDAPIVQPIPNTVAAISPSKIPVLNVVNTPHPPTVARQPLPAKPSPPTVAPPSPPTITRPPPASIITPPLPVIATPPEPTPATPYPLTIITPPPPAFASPRRPTIPIPRAKHTPPTDVIPTPPPPTFVAEPPPVTITPFSTVKAPPPTITTPTQPIIATPSPPTVAMGPTLAIASPSQHAKTTPPPAVMTTPPTTDRSSSPPPPRPVAPGDYDTVLSSRSGPPSHTPPSPASSIASLLERPLSVQERPVSPLSVLGRASEITPPKKKGSDIIFLALEKAKRKYASSPLIAPTPSSPVTPTMKDSPFLLSSSPSFEKSFQNLPAIDYGDQADAPYATTLDSTLVNGFGHNSPSLDRIAEEGVGDALPPLMVVPPPTARRQLLEHSIPGPPPEKPRRPASMDLKAFEFSKAHPAVELPELEDVQSGLEALKLQSTPGTLQTDTWENELYEDPHALPLVAGRGPDTILPRKVPLDEESQVENLEDREISGSEPTMDNVPASPSSQDPPSASGYQGVDSHYEDWENAYELMPSAKKKDKGQHTKKNKTKNPYAASSSPTEEKGRNGRFSKKSISESPDEKDAKKKEKQRLEKERKDLKEQKEREKKEQKEREKKENDIKKKFKITGQEEAMYQATVTEASKGRKDNLSVNVGDIVSVIRTTNCPKGKWLARDSSNTYGYVSVSQVQLDIQEMLAIGKIASQAKSRNGNLHSLKQAGEVNSRSSNTFGQQEDTGSFTDDSEEWPVDEDEAQPYPADGATESTVHSRTKSMPVLGTTEQSSFLHQHTLSETTTDGPDLEARFEALQKLNTFFHKPGGEPKRKEAPTSPVDLEGREPVFTHNAGDVLELPETVILPPPDLYADNFM